MGSKKFPRGDSLKPIGSIFQKLFHGRRDMAFLRQDYVLEFGLIRAESIHGRHAPDGGVQILKKFVRDARRDFRAKAPAQRVFVSYDNAVSLSNGGRNGFPVVRR